ncbi:MAG: protein-L-isoaspartate O-methyltransferase [Wenzhouxiangellaceae bacterium]|nr:protein-L-isoaspartate O-methyltransferase [Wenzhouxiangellaceae bacterium]
MSLDQARTSMIEQQVRSWEVLDGAVLEVMREIPREEFVPQAHRKLAFYDLRIPLGHGQVMMKPIEQGRVLQALLLKPDDRVLEIGTGTGFLTACLARLAGSVVSIEIIEALAEQARANIGKTEAIELRFGDVLQADFQPASFDAIVATSSVASVPQNLTAWLKPGGRLFIVRGQSPAMEAVLVTRTESAHLSEESLFDTDLPRLIGAEDAPSFKF